MSEVEPSDDDKSCDVVQEYATEGEQSTGDKTSDCETIDANPPVTMVKFMSVDKDTYIVEEKVATKFCFPDVIMERAIDKDRTITLDGIDSDILEIMMKWAERHVNDPEIVVNYEDNDEVKRTDDIDAWDNALLSLEPPKLFRLMIAARFGKMTSLLNVAVKKTATLFKGKSVEELRTTFNIRKNVEK